MKINDIYCFFLVILAFSSCAKEAKVELERKKQINQAVITSIDYVNSNANEVTSEYDYSYENDIIKEITKEGKKHITFKYQNNKVIEKKYFNNHEEVINMESFIYDLEGKLKLINSYNNMGELGYSREIIYDSGQLSKLKETFFIPTTSSQEYDFIYSGSNIDSVIFSTVNHTYVYEYFEEINKQNLNFFIEEMGLYQVGQYAINGITLPIIFSSKRIKSVRGYNSSGGQTFEYIFDHLISDNQYNEIYFEWYDQNQEILNSTKVEFKY